MAKHKAFIANGVYPWFGSTAAKYRNFASRAGHIADLMQGCDTAFFNEMGFAECQALAGKLGDDWQYDRAQGGGSGHFSQGINSVWTRKSIFNQPEDDLDEYPMPSGGQTPGRTLLLARVTEVKDPTAFVTLGAFHETLGNDAGMAYIVKLISKIGDRRVLLGGDFKRTDDDDDVRVMKKAGYVFHERVNATPMTCITQGNVPVTGVDHRNDSRAFDHEFIVVDYSIPTGKVLP